MQYVTEQNISLLDPDRWAKWILLCLLKPAKNLLPFHFFSLSRSIHSVWHPSWMFAFAVIKRQRKLLFIVTNPSHLHWCPRARPSGKKWNRGIICKVSLLLRLSLAPCFWFVANHLGSQERTYSAPWNMPFAQSSLCVWNCYGVTPQSYLICTTPFV